MMLKAIRSEHVQSYTILGRVCCQGIHDRMTLTCFRSACSIQLGDPAHVMQDMMATGNVSGNAVDFATWEQGVLQRLHVARGRPTT